MVEFSNIDIKDLASFVSESLNSNSIEAILVGGACVSIYSQNRYQSFDLDFVTYEELKRIEEVLVKLGFKRVGRCFSRDDCPYLIDFVNPPVAIGNESIRRFESLKTTLGTLKLLTPTDCIKDRLSSFYFWNDLQALEQALLVAKDHPVDLKDIKRWSKEEGHLDKFTLFLEKFNERC